MICTIAVLAAGAQQLPAAGTAWQFLGPAPIQDGLDSIGAVGGEVTALAFGPVGQIYAATGWGGVWESGDGGTTWTEISATAAAQLGGFTVHALAVAPNGTLYAGTGSLSQPGVGAVGLLATSDAGASWQQLGPFAGQTISAVNEGITAAGQAEIIVTVTGPTRGGVWSSNDGGGTWTAAVQATAFGYAQLGSNIWASTEGAQGWTVTYWDGGLGSASQTTVPSWPAGTVPAAVYLAASNSDVIALGVSSTGACVGVEVQKSGNTAWGPLDGGCPAGDTTGPAAVMFDAAGNLWLGGAGLWELPEGETTWAPVTGLSGGVGALAAAPGTAGSLYAGTTDGLWRQNCAASCTWQNATGNLGAVQVASAAVTGLGAVWIGAEQGGVAGQPGWITAIGGSNGAQVAAAAEDEDNLGLVYAALPNASGIEVSTDSGTSFASMPFGSAGPSAAFAPLLAVDPANAEQVYYAAGQQIWQSGDGGASWTPAGGPAGAAITALAVAAGANGAPPQVAAGDGNGEVTVNGGAWSALSTGSGGAVAAVTAIAVTSGGTVFAAAGSALFTGTEGSWQALSGLPAGTTILALAADPVEAGTVYAGTRTGGVVGSPDGGQTWYALGTGLPDAPVVALALDMHDRELVAGTQGRGVWEMQLGRAAANVTLSGAATGAVGSTVTLTATVVNALGLAVAGATVDWSASAGAMISTTATNSQGETSDTLTLPETAGPVTVSAGVAGIPEGQGRLTVTVAAGAATDLTAVAGGGQSGVAGQPLAQPLAAEVSDSHGNPVAGVAVTFADGGAGGSFTPADGEATSGSDGQASVGYTLPDKTGAVAITATAAVGEMSLPPATFSETANPPPGFTLSLTPATVTAEVASTASFTLASSAINGDSKVISLQCSMPVTGCTITPGTISPGGSARVSVATGNLALGGNTIEVAGSDGAQTVQAEATVQVPKPDFTLTLTPSAPEANQQSAFGLTVTAGAINGAYAQIALSCPQPASGCTISPTSITPGQTAAVTIAAGTLAPGAQQITVTGLDSTDQETHTATAAVTVVAAGLAVAAAPASVSLAAGGSDQMAVTATPEGGLSGLVAFSCSGLPVAASCSFTPATATSTGDAVASTLVISTTADSAAPPAPTLGGPPWPWGLAAVALWGLVAAAERGWGAGARTKARATAAEAASTGGCAGPSRRSRGRRQAALAAGILILGLALLAGCGGGGGAPADPPAVAPAGTPSGTYTVRIKAISGTVSGQASITLQVN